MYICSLCRLHGDMSLDDVEQQDAKKGHFELNSHIDNFNEKIKIKINKSIEDKFVDIIFDFNKLVNNHIHSDLHFKEIIREKLKKIKRKIKNINVLYQKYINTEILQRTMMIIHN